MKKKLFDYDDRSVDSIYQYAKQLEKMTFREVKEMFDSSPRKSYVNMYELTNPDIKPQDCSFFGGSFNQNAKGQLGNFLERMFFGYNPNSNQGADFPKAGLELKLTTIDRDSKGGFRAGERLVITNISYDEPIEEDFYKSHVWEKIQKILLIHYVRDKSIDRLDYQVEFVNIFSPSWFEEDLAIIIQDYNAIVKKIKEGKAHELSESDTRYLGACTKGETAEKSIRPQYYGNQPAKKRSFCFKVSYMNYLLQERVLNNALHYESILHGLDTTDFEEYTLKMINAHIGMTDKELCYEYGREYNNNKAQWNDLTFRMIGIKGNNAEEFVKSNIVVKTIRIEENGKNKESMSFPPFKFKELVSEEWEESTIYNYFETTRFLFVVYQRSGDNYILQGAQMWNMPYYDLNVTVKREWEHIRNTIANGVTFTITAMNDGSFLVRNNLPGISDSEIIHVRPHANKAAYKLKNGFQIGNINRDANELPDGQWMTTQSFWINSKYILKQLVKKRQR